MTEPAAKRYRFGAFEADAATGELRRQGVRVRLHVQPFRVLCMFLERPGELLTREEICRELWPDGTFVDYEHGVNSAVNRLRDALGDKAASPRFVETLARRGYRFVAPVENLSANTDAGPTAVAPASGPKPTASVDGILASPHDLPHSSPAAVRLLFLALQVMYFGFYVGALANLGEIGQLLVAVRYPSLTLLVLVVTAALLIPVRTFLVCAVLFRAPRIRSQFLKLWWGLMPLDILWALSPFLLLHHIDSGVALACVTLLVYSPFAQRSLILMGGGDERV